MLHRLIASLCPKINNNKKNKTKQNRNVQMVVHMELQLHRVYSNACVGKGKDLLRSNDSDQWDCPVPNALLSTQQVAARTGEFFQ